MLELKKVDLRGVARKCWDVCVDFQWLMLGFVFVSAFVLGFVGIHTDPAVSVRPTVFDSFYQTIQLFWMNYSPREGSQSFSIEAAEFLAGVFFLLFSLKVVWTVFRDQLLVLWLRMRPPHTVVCGLGRIGSHLVTNLLPSHQDAVGDAGSKVRSRPPGRVVVIERDAENDDIADARQRGAIVLIGNATTGAMLRRAGAHRAKRVAVMCGQDDTNQRVCEALVKLQPPSAQLVRVHVSQPLLLRLLNAGVRTKEEKSVTENKNTPPPSREATYAILRSKWFCSYDMGALMMTLSRAPFPEGVSLATAAPRVLVIGLGDLGTSLVELLGRWGYLYHLATGRKLHITLASNNASQKREIILAEFPGLEQWCEIETWDGDLGSVDFLHGHFLPADAPAPDVAYCCLNDDGLALTIANAFCRHDQLKKTQLVLRFGDQTICRTVTDGLHDHCVGIRLMDAACDQDFVFDNRETEVIARAVHLNYVFQQLRTGSPGGANMKPWDALDEFEKESNRDFARHIPIKLKKFGYRATPLIDWPGKLLEFTEDEVERLAQMEHERYCSFYTQHGWKVGEVGTGKVGKLHEALRPWSELGSQQDGFQKDYRETTRQMIRAIPGDLFVAGFVLERRGSVRDLSEAQLEGIAEAIHEEYRRSQTAAAPGHAGASPIAEWSALTEEQRRASRAHARGIALKLGTIGHRVVPIADAAPALTRLTEEDVERLSRIEHDRWMAERRAAGWVYGEVKSAESKTHPDLVPWDDLDEPGREKDRVLVRAIPALLAVVGLAATPAPGAERKHGG